MTKRIGTWFGYGWAMPVVKHRWAFWCSVCEFVKVRSGYRLAVHACANAHCRATDVARLEAFYGCKPAA